MKLKYLVALLALLTLGCAAGDGSSTPAPDTTSDTTSVTTAPETDATSSETAVAEEAMTQVSLNVTGMR